VLELGGELDTSAESGGRKKRGEGTYGSYDWVVA